MAIVLGAIVLKYQAERARPRASGSPCNITLPILKKEKMSISNLPKFSEQTMKKSGFYPKSLFLTTARRQESPRRRSN